MKTIVSWSGGKDSAVLLHSLLNDPDYEVAGLFTTFSGDDQEVNLHHVPFEFIRAQAESLGLPLFPVNISAGASNEEYEKAHQEVFEKLHHEKDIRYVAFGDIFLNEIRSYREKMVSKTSLQPVFPLWEMESHEIVKKFLEKKFQAYCVAARSDLPGEQFAGRELNHSFFSNLPTTADQCGENGEYHSFVFDGPDFSKKVNVKPGKPYLKDYNPVVDLQMLVAPLVRN